MQNPFVKSLKLPALALWEKIISQRKLISFDLEITARCNNNCRHCYINLPADNRQAQAKELSLTQIKNMADQAVSLGAIWCLLTGGEPLLRKDFFDIFLFLKKKGLLVSVFTNAALITDKHIELFKEYPPRDIEVTVYGTTKEIHEKVTRIPGSYDAFTRGLNLLLKSGIKVRLKAMALRSNAEELPQIAAFCRERTMDYFRFDPYLHLRFDGNPERNEEIKSERLSPEEIVAIERADRERLSALEKYCERLTMPESEDIHWNSLFDCGAGIGSFSISYDGHFRLCPSLGHPDCIYDLKKGDLTEAWENFVIKVRDIRSNREEFLKKCRTCQIIRLCMWCPARSHLEIGELDTPADYFCKIAHARAEWLIAHLGKRDNPN